MGSLTGLAVGDVIEVTGSTSNNDVFTVADVSLGADLIEVNKSPTPETGAATVTLVCKAKNAPIGYGQGWIQNYAQTEYEYTNSTGRTIVYTVMATYSNAAPGEYITLTVDGVVRDISQTAGTTSGYNVAVTGVIPNGSTYEWFSSALTNVTNYQNSLQ